MKELRSISEYDTFGKVDIKVKEFMDKKGINVYRMSKMADRKHQTVKAYYNNEPLARVDLEVVSKLCYVLDCKIEDILVYNPPK